MLAWFAPAILRNCRHRSLSVKLSFCRRDGCLCGESTVVRKLCQNEGCSGSLLVTVLIQETNGLLGLTAPEVTASHGRYGMAELIQQEGCQAAGTRETITHTHIFSYPLPPPRHHLLKAPYTPKTAKPTGINRSNASPCGRCFIFNP